MGHVLAALLRAHPEMQGVLFDRFGQKDVMGRLAGQLLAGAAAVVVSRCCPGMCR